MASYILNALSSDIETSAAHPKNMTSSKEPVRPPCTDRTAEHSHTSHPNHPSMQGVASPSPQPPPRYHLPLEFNLYRHRMGWYLATSAGKPIHAVSVDKTPSIFGSLALHSGPDASSPTLATAKHMSGFYGSKIIISPPPGSDAPPLKARVERTVRGCSIYWVFQIGVGPGGREEFQWRHRYGPTICQLGCDSGGWKLVRKRKPSRDPAPSTEPTPEISTASDGREIVAAWSTKGLGLGTSDVAKFKFIGEGASGVLGEAWAIMAVITILAWEDCERRRRFSYSRIARAVTPRLVFWRRNTKHGRKGCQFS